MTKRSLGRTGLHVSILGIGDLADRTVPLETCVGTLRRALDFGLNVVDTAPGYENRYSEKTVGAALKGRRDVRDENRPSLRHGGKPSAKLLHHGSGIIKSQVFLPREAAHPPRLLKVTVRDGRWLMVDSCELSVECFVP